MIKLMIKEKDEAIPVSVISETGKKYGIVIGTYNNLVCVLLNTGEYVDVPGHKVKRLSKKTKFVTGQK